MTFSRRFALALGIFTSALLLKAELPEWAGFAEAGSRAEQILFQVIQLGGNAVAWRRPPRDTAADLERQSQQAPNEAAWQYLLAREAELVPDTAKAAAAWDRYVSLAPDKQSAWEGKADFYSRRNDAPKEIGALLEAARLPNPPAEEFYPPARQTSWRLFERAVTTAREHLLDNALVYSAWQQRHPTEKSAWRLQAENLLASRKWADYEALLARYRTAFPQDEAYPILAAASLERARTSPAAARAVFEKSFRPDWPAEVATAYFALLSETSTTAAFLRDNRNPKSLSDAVRLALYYQSAQDLNASRQTLQKFLDAQQQPLAPAEMLLLATLLSRFEAPREAALLYQKVYLADGSEAALAELTLLMLSTAAQPIPLGAGNLSFYRDIAAIDPSPGFWNGIQSLLFNTSSVKASFNQREQRSGEYFQRAKAVDLVMLFEGRFPQSGRRAELEAALIGAYSAQGETSALISRARPYLAAHPAGPQLVTVATLLAEAYAQRNQIEDEFALYDSLLASLAAQAANVPLGNVLPIPRSPDYARMLDRYIARLVSLKRPTQALALLRRELDRNPNDPALYERLASFLEQNRVDAEVEAVYTRAMGQFSDRSWASKLARYYLRTKQGAKLDRLSKEVAAIFAGAELGQYVAVAAQGGQITPQLYRNINLYGLQRFPHYLPFVRNLLAAYSTKATANPAEWERLLRNNWQYDEGLRAQYFEYLSRTGKLNAELAALRPSIERNPAALRFVAEGESWKAHFEAAAPLFESMAASYPADTTLVTRAASLERSLGNSDAALKLEEQLARAWPATHEPLTRMGEIEADREQFQRAAAQWDRIPATHPGNPAGYLETATLYWDYFRFDDALRQIANGRAKLNEPALYAYEAGAIHESRGEEADAVKEYIQASLAAGEDSPARRRLLTLAPRARWRSRIEQATASLPATRGAIDLRVALLAEAGSKAELERYLTSLATQTSDPDLLTAIEAHANASSLDAVVGRVLSRRVALAADEIDALRLRLRQARFDETHNIRPTGYDAILRANPKRLGVIRAAVDYHLRANDPSAAVSILRASAAIARSDYARAFRLEAANRTPDTATSVAIASELLSIDPFDSQAVAAKADALARAGNQAELASLYKDRIQALAASNLSPAAKAEKIDVWRRASIPALAKTGNFTEAHAQYIELLRKYPEDQTLLDEAIRFARPNGGTAQIIAYFAKAEKDSPRDGRWPVIRARLETAAVNPNEALAAWTRAVNLRPESRDILLEKAKLEEKLLDWDQAAQSYTKLYELTYHDPQYLTSAAKQRLRQGRQQEAIQMVRRAWLEGKPDNEVAHARIAETFADWSLLEPARIEFEKGLPSPRYSEVMTRLQRYTEVPLAKLDLEASASSAGRYFNPAERGAYGTWLQSLQGRVQNPALIEAAQRAGLEELRVRLLADNLYQLVEAQNARMRFSELGRQLEKLWISLPPDNQKKPQALEAAITAFEHAGNRVNALRLARAQLQLGGNPQAMRLYIRLASQGTVIVPPAGTEAGVFNDQVAAYGFETGNEKLALLGIVGQNRPRLWTDASKALWGLYFHKSTPDIRLAFQGALGPEKIGAKLALAGSRNAALTGDAWFYYAGRFGEYAADPGYVAAIVEQRSSSARAYHEEALTLSSLGRTAEALAAWRNAIAIDPNFPEAYAGIARLQPKAEAVDAWKQAFKAFAVARITPATVEALRDALSSAPVQSLLPEFEAVLTTYLNRGGAYRAAELLEPLAPSVDWILKVANSTSDPGAVLSSLRAAAWLSPPQQDALDRNALRIAEARYAAALGDRKQNLRYELDQMRMNYATRMADRGNVAELPRMLDVIGDRDSILHVRLAVLENRVPEEMKRTTVSSPQLLELASTLAKTNPAASRQIRTAIYERDSEPASLLGLADVRLEEGNLPAAKLLLEQLTLQAVEPFSQHPAAADVLLAHGQDATKYLNELSRAEPWRDQAVAPRKLPSGIPALRDAIAAEPGNAEIRRRLFDAFIAAGRYSDAVLAIGPKDEILATPERIAEYAAALARTGEKSRAIAIYRALPNSKAAIEKLRKELELEAKNAARRPMISANVEQPGIVRPMLTGGVQ